MESNPSLHFTSDDGHRYPNREVEKSVGWKRLREGKTEDIRDIPTLFIPVFLTLSHIFFFLHLTFAPPILPVSFISLLFLSSHTRTHDRLSHASPNTSTREHPTRDKITKGDFIDPDTFRLSS